MTVALLRTAAGAAPAGPGLIWAPLGERPVRWTFAELLAAAERVAHRLAAELSPGRALALQASPDDAWLDVQYGAALAGLVLVVLPPRLPGRASVALARRAGAERILDAGAVRSLLASDASARPLPDVPATAVAQVQLTSGTSTEPRGVMLSRAALARQAAAVAAGLALGPSDVVLNPNPLYHVSGQFFSLAALAGGATHLLSPYEPEHLLSVLAAEQASILGLPPALLVPLLDACADRPRELGALRLVALGGMRVEPELQARGERLWRVPLCTAYGLTEAGGLTHLVRPTDPPEVRRHSVGRPLDGVEARIVDPASGTEFAAGTEGEVHVRLSAPMTGYLRDAAATRGRVCGRRLAAHGRPRTHRQRLPDRARTSR